MNICYQKNNTYKSSFRGFKKPDNTLVFKGKWMMENLFLKASKLNSDSTGMEFAKSLGKAFLAPLVILFNPFCKDKDKDGRKASAIVQPLEAGFTSLATFLSSKLALKFLLNQFLKVKKFNAFGEFYNISKPKGRENLKILYRITTDIISFLMIFPASLAINWISPKLINRFAPEKKNKNNKKLFLEG